MKFCVLALLFFNLTFAHAQENSVYIKVGEAKVKKSLMALPAFQFFSSPSQSKDSKSIGAELYNTVNNDLDVSAYFQFIKPEAFLDDTAKVGLKPAPGEPNGFNFDNWKKIGAEFLVRAGFTIIKDEITLETYVYYVPQAKLIFGKKYSGPSRAARRIAHTFCNDVVEKLTGKKGMFLSRAVASTDRPTGKWKEIYVMDWDGNGLEAITSHKGISISPAWSPGCAIFSAGSVTDVARPTV